MPKPNPQLLLGSALTTILLVIVATFHNSGASPPSEVQTITAAYLYNFIKLSEWPKGIVMDKITLCISQDGDYAVELEALEGKTAHNLPLKIRQIVQGENADDSQMLFLPQEEKPVRMQEWLKNLEKQPVLTVSNQEDFLDKGGMIALFNDGKRLQFSVDLKRVEQAGIKLSSKMLQVASEVREE